MKRVFHKIFRRQSTRTDARRRLSRRVVFALCLLTIAFFVSAGIFTRLSPSPLRTLESAGAKMLSTTAATVNGVRATISALAFPAPPRAAGAETARLWGGCFCDRGAASRLELRPRTSVIVVGSSSGHFMRGPMS